MSNTAESRPRIGISTCLLGEQVRYDGGHKRNEFLVEAFGNYVEWVSVCPEVEIGLGIPRDALRLEERSDGVHMITIRSGEDHTRKMTEYSMQRVRELEKQDLSGYVLKRGSPSCGLERVRVYRENSQMHRAGRGLYAEQLVAHLPQLPVEEEGRLSDPRLRENFVARVFALHRWKQIERGGLTRAAIMEFHARHKFLLMARSQAGMRRLGKLVGEAAQQSTVEKLAADYSKGFAEVMARTPTRRNHTNVLEHLAGFFTDQLEQADRDELIQTVKRYRLELVPLIVPVTLIRHYVRKLDVAYLRNQIYLEPHPEELSLLNLV